eukprot:4089640-Amphidinium_carterae.1
MGRFHWSRLDLLSDGHAPQQLVPVAPHGQVPSVLLRPAVPLGQTSVLASQNATHALAEQGSVGLSSELSRMISETSVSNPFGRAAWTSS